MFFGFVTLAYSESPAPSPFIGFLKTPYFSWQVSNFQVQISDGPGPEAVPFGYPIVAGPTSLSTSGAVTTLTSSFTDFDGFGAATNTTDSAIVQWGDGTSSAAAVDVIAGTNGSQFQVTATHIYTEQVSDSITTYSLAMQISDGVGGGLSLPAADLGVSLTGGLEVLPSGDLVEDDDGTLSSPVQTNVSSFLVYNPTSEVADQQPAIFALHSDPDHTLWVTGTSSTGVSLPSVRSSTPESRQSSSGRTVHSTHCIRQRPVTHLQGAISTSLRQERRRTRQ